MYKLYLKVDDKGIITHTLFGSFKGEPKGFEYNFIVEDNEMVAELRNSTADWYVKDDKLCRKEEINIKVEPIKPEGSEDDVIRANGVDQYRITVPDYTATPVDLWMSNEKIVLPVGEELFVTSKVSTAFRLEAKGLEYKMQKPLFLRFR